MDKAWINSDITHHTIGQDSKHGGVKKFISVTPLEDSRIVHKLALPTPVSISSFHEGHLLPTSGSNTAFNEGTIGVLEDGPIGPVLSLPPILSATAFDDDHLLPTPGSNTAFNEGTFGEAFTNISASRASHQSLLSTPRHSNHTCSPMVNEGGAALNSVAHFAAPFLVGNLSGGGEAHYHAAATATRRCAADRPAFTAAMLAIFKCVVSCGEQNFCGACIPIPTNLHLPEWAALCHHEEDTVLFLF